MGWLGLVCAPVALASFVAAALSMDRHHRALFGRPCPPDLRLRLRWAARAGFLITAGLAVAGGGVAIVACVLTCGLAAGLVVLGLTIRG